MLNAVTETVLDEAERERRAKRVVASMESRRRRRERLGIKVRKKEGLADPKLLSILVGKEQVENLDELIKDMQDAEARGHQLGPIENHNRSSFVREAITLHMDRMIEKLEKISKL